MIVTTQRDRDVARVAYAEWYPQGRQQLGIDPHGSVRSELLLDASANRRVQQRRPVAERLGVPSARILATYVVEKGKLLAE